jgi:polysaccharide biosynthesis transport protein
MPQNQSQPNALPMPSASTDNLDLVDLQQYWLALKRRWKPAALVFATTVAAAGFLANQQKPTYSASGKLLLRTNRVPSLTGLGGELSGTQALSLGSVGQLTQQSSPLRTESENLLSRPVLERTIQALNLRDSKGTLLRPEELAPKIKVKDVPGADVLKVTYADRDKKRAALVVNQLLQEYIANNVAMTRSEATAAREFIAQELPKSEALVRQTDAAVREFKERNGIANLANEEQLLSSALGEIDKQVNAVRTELTDANSRYGSLQTRLGMGTQQALAAGSLSQSPGVQQAVAQWQQLQSQLKLERSRLQDTHPRIQDLMRKEASLRQIIQARVNETIGQQGQPIPSENFSMGEIKQSLIKDYLSAEVNRASLGERLGTLTNARSAYRERLNLLPRLEQQQRELQRRLEVSQATYANLLKRLQEVQFAERQTVGTARIIESAVPAQEAGGSPKVMLLGLGSLLGTLLACGTLLGLELADRSVKTVKEARDLFGYPLVGTIPYWGNPKRAKRLLNAVPGLPVRDLPRSVVSAAYRMLQANLRFLNLDQPLKSIAITSSIPREGKSTVAANLAATMAQLGRRTLLIDADLHHPTQDRIWQVSNESGLSDLLIGQTQFKEAAKSVMENLDVLTAGSMPPNPLALLDSKRMAQLLKGLEQAYDFVIIDTPPLVLEAEALTVGHLAQGVLLVARPSFLPSAPAKKAKELLNYSGVKVLGLVANSAVLEPEPYRNDDYSRDYPARERLPVMV